MNIIKTTLLLLKNYEKVGYLEVDRIGIVNKEIRLYSLEGEKLCSYAPQNESEQLGFSSADMSRNGNVRSSISITTAGATKVYYEYNCMELDFVVTYDVSRGFLNMLKHEEYESGELVCTFEVSKYNEGRELMRGTVLDGYVLGTASWDSNGNLISSNVVAKQ